MSHTIWSIVYEEGKEPVYAGRCQFNLDQGEKFFRKTLSELFPKVTKVTLAILRAADEDPRDNPTPRWVKRCKEIVLFPAPKKRKKAKVKPKTRKPKKNFPRVGKKKTKVRAKRR